MNNFGIDVANIRNNIIMKSRFMSLKKLSVIFMLQITETREKTLLLPFKDAKCKTK